MGLVCGTPTISIPADAADAWTAQATTITPAVAPKAGVIVVTCAVRAVAAGINLVGVPQTKPMQ